MNLFFDTETTGLPPKNADWYTDYELFPHIVQLAWKCSDQSNVNNYIIKPEGWTIPEESTKIHGITHEYALKTGVHIDLTLTNFIKDCFNAKHIIGHNIYFDTSIIKANLLKYANDMLVINNMIAALFKDKRIDTMMKTIKFCNIKQNDSNRLKFPTLIELHNKLFNEPFDAHDAKYDVLATERCFNELVRIGII